MKKILSILVVIALMIAAFSTLALADGEELDIAVVSISATESGNARYISGLQDACDARGWKLTVFDANGSTDNANSSFNNFIARGADAIIDMVFPATSLMTGLNAAIDAGIPVLTWGGGLAEGVWHCNGSGGPHAIGIVEKMCEDMNGEGEILALTYHGGQVARDREDVLDGILEKYPNIKVTKSEVDIPGYIQDGMEYANAWLASRPEGDANYAIWGSWDDPALGAISTLKQMDRRDVKVYGENGNADAIQAVRDGWMTATAWEDCYAEGLASIEAIETIREQGDAFEKGAYELQATIITAENVEAVIAEHPELIENVN